MMSLKDRCHKSEVKGIGRRTQLLDNFRNRRKYWKLKEEAGDRKGGIDSLSIEHKEEIQVMNLLISSIFNNNIIILLLLI